MAATLAFDYASADTYGRPSPRIEWVTETPYLKSKSNNHLLKRSTSSVSQTNHDSGNLTRDIIVENIQREFNRLLISFAKQWHEKKELFAFQDSNVIENAVTNSIIALILLEADNLRCEVTSDETILFRAQIRDLSVHWAIVFDADEPEQYEVILNAYQQKHHVLATGGSCAEVMSKLVGKAYPKVAIPA